MILRVKGSRLAAMPLLVLACAVALAACGGGGSGRAAAVLRGAFSGSHAVTSGDLRLALTVAPTGSSTARGPIRVSFGGPFQSRGPGRLPASAFQVAISAAGRTSSLSVLSTGTSGYVTLGGASYRLPASSFQRLESSFSQIGSGPGGGAGALGRLGIDPSRWLIHPTVLGNASIGGVRTTHIRAGVNVGALLTDLNRFLARAASLGVSGASRLPTGPAFTRQVGTPSFEVWVGARDETIRRLAIDLTLPVTGSLSTALGRVPSARLALTLQYNDLNRPQTIGAPRTVKPYSGFAAKLRALLGSIQSSLSG